MPSRKLSRKNAQKANVRSESGAKATVNIREAAVSEETRQAQDEKNRRGSGSSHSLNLTEAKSSKSKSLGDQVNRNPGACIGEKTSGRRSRPRSIPEYLHKWKPPFQPGGNKSTQRQPGSQGETWRARKRKPIQFHASLRVKTGTTGGTEKWPKEGGGTTGLIVSKTRHRHQPRTSHHLQETSQARFLHLDKIKVKSRRGQGI